jgi:site-specific DNA-methyltransferase (adenine-specific)
VKTNVLYYGDNLDILRRYIPDESVDLIYLDPPFNSNRDYNVIFKDESGRKSDAQLVAFEDTWHWGPDAERVYDYLTNTSRHEGRVPDNVSTIVAALRHGIGENQMMAYLVEMAARLVELHRVLKPTGSLYLHCDPTASHYLKVVLDAVFGFENFRNELIWQRTLSKGLMTRQLPNNHDVLLAFTKTPGATWCLDEAFDPYDPSDLDAKTASKYSHRDSDGRIYRLDNLINPNPDRPNLTYEFLGVIRVWRWTRERMQAAYEDGLVVQTKPGGVPQLKRYLDAQRGRPFGDIWTDIPPINSQAKERLGYPTQKPASLLERVIRTSSNPGDVVLDPFCGCGTALVAAEKLGRRWIGIDITYLSIAVMKARLKDSFQLDDVEVIGQPTEVEGARQLLTQNNDGRYQFQWWALGLVDAKPLGGVQKKGADRGIDGKITFTDEHGRLEQVLVSVKSGHVDSSQIRDLKGTLEREKAAIGLFITLEEPTSHMKQEAATAGLWHSTVWNRDYPKIQILTIRELLEEHRKPDLPAFVHAPYQRAERVDMPMAAEQGELFGEG